LHRNTPRGAGGRRALALLACLVAGCGHKAPPAATGAAAEQPAVSVTLAPVTARPLRRTVAAVGTLYGFDEATLSPKVDGRIARVTADVGDLILPGAVLLELDPTDYQLAVAEARQGLLSELAKLGLDALPAGEFDLARVPAVRRAAVALEDAQRRFKLKKDILARGAGSRDEYDLAETEVRLADAARVQAETEARAVLATARLKQASLALAEQKLRDTTLAAPVPAGYPAWAAVVGAGMTPVRFQVAQRMVTEGEMIRSMPVTNAFRLVLDFALKLRASVPERYAADVRVGQPVEVSVDAYPGRAFAGRVARVNPTVDPLNRTFMVEVEVGNARGELKCGGFARAAIRTRLDPNVLTVPPAAVVAFAGVNKVFVADTGKVRAVEVQLGTRDRDWVEVAGDLTPGAKVVTSGQSQLVDGSPIKVRE
jgi:multidrug efflux pump subunit AcrA (membrane-fusion protein)